MSLLVLFRRRGQSPKGTPSRGRVPYVLEEFVKDKKRPKVSITKEEQEKLRQIRKTLKSLEALNVRSPGIKHDLNLIDALLNPPTRETKKTEKIKEIQPLVSNLIDSLLKDVLRDSEDATLIIILADE